MQCTTLADDKDGFDGKNETDIAGAAMTAPRALVVEDDHALRTLLRLLLEDEGIIVTEAADGAAAIASFLAEPADIVLLDLRLPELNGFDVCRAIRRTSGVPIIMVTAQHDSHDVVAGLECGADDYVTKPYNDRELIARVRVQLRRQAESPQPRSVISIGDVEIRVAEGVVTKDGDELNLTKTEFCLLVQLAGNPNRIWSRDQLLEIVWEYPTDGDGRLVDTHIRRLRTKIEADPSDPTIIRTVRGLGYKLVA